MNFSFPLYISPCILRLYKARPQPDKDMGIPLKRTRPKAPPNINRYHARLKQLLETQEDLQRIRYSTLQRRNSVYRVSRERELAREAEQERSREPHYDSDSSIDSGDEVLHIGYGRPAPGRLRASIHLNSLLQYVLRREDECE